MISEILYEKNNYLTLLFWVLLGAFTGPLVYVAVPIHMLVIKNKGEWLWLVLGLWLVLTLSDSRQSIFSFATNLKTAMMLVMGYLFLIMPKEGDAWRFVKPFIPFFIIAFPSLFGSPLAFEGFQKTVSYFLLLLVIPGFVNLLLTHERDRFLYHLVMVGVIVLAAGIVLRSIYPEFVIFKGERYSGLMGNPNGMGIYGFVFTALFTIIQHFQPHLFSRKETILIYALVFASLIFGGSRGGLFATGIFLAAWFLIRRDVVLGLVTMSLIFISYQVVMTNFVDVVQSLGWEDYFRLETLETQSGRIYAREVAWESIRENYWFSNGFSFNEHVLAQHRDYFEKMGHQGNIHNSWLTMWVDTGLAGVVLWGIGWLVNFIRAARFSPMVWAVFFGVLLSGTVESWLVASLNPFTIVLVIILSMMSHPAFYEPEEEMVGRSVGQ